MSIILMTKSMTVPTAETMKTRDWASTSRPVPTTLSLMTQAKAPVQTRR